MSARRTLGLYEDFLRLRYAARTAAAYLSDIRNTLAWLDERGVALSDLKTDDLLAYQTHLGALRKKDGKPYGVSLQMNRLSAIKSFFGFLYRRGYLLADPSASLEFPRAENRLPRSILTRQEAKRIVEAPDKATPLGLRDRAILETFYATGMRVSELAKLTPQDVDTEERVVRIVLGKGGKDRNVPLTRASAAAIEEYLTNGRPRMRGARKSKLLFLAKRGGKLHNAQLASIVKGWAKRAHVKKDVTPHTFRHSVATHLLRNRADIRHIQTLLGHATLATTERYTRVEVSDLKKVIERAHPRGK